MNKHDFKIRGYIIERRYFIGTPLDRWSNWFIYWTKKLYITKEIAEEALTYINNEELSMFKIEYRIVPLYVINYERI